MWKWLLENSAELQALSACITAVFASLSVFVLFSTKRALVASERQAKAAEDATRLMTKQMALAALSEDRATRPLLKLVVKTSQSMDSLTLINVGLGPAYSITVEHALGDVGQLSLRSDTLAVGAEAEIDLIHRYIHMGYKVTYFSSHGTKLRSIALLTAGILDYVTSFEIVHQAYE